MTYSKNNLLKTLASTTAEKLCEEDGAVAVELMAKLGLLELPSETSTRNGNWKYKPDAIGIWEPKKKGNEISCERSKEWEDEWKFWADISGIGAKSSKKRVVLIGESVARGYLYDPGFNPAKVLKTMLDGVDISGGVEVIDLAKVNLLFKDQLFELVKSALSLEPDAIIIFAGNNLVSSRDELKKKHLPVLFREHEGVHGLIPYFKELLLLEVKKIKQLLVDSQIPSVFIIPEFNLGDWQFEESADAPWLPEFNNEKWFSSLVAARKSLASDSLTDAEKYAREMVKLDRGTASTGFNILAECKRRSGSLKEARDFLEKARDAHVFWDFFTVPIPQPHSDVQNELRQNFQGENLSFVDLPLIFNDWLEGELPDRRLFLDYCHLTSEGILVAMAAATEQIATLLGGTKKGYKELVDGNILPDPGLEAEARFSAAIHNAHSGQRYDIVHHHCLKSLELSNNISNLMVQYVDLTTRRAPAWMCESAERIINLGFPVTLRYLLNYNSSKLLSPVLFDAIADALEENGVEAKEKLEKLRLSEQGITINKPCNLLDDYYAPSWVDRDWNRAQGYFRSCSHRSFFHFVSQDVSSLSLNLTCRLEDTATRDNVCKIVVNDELLEEIQAETNWKSWQFTVPDSMIREGLNSVRIEWPIQVVSGEIGMQRAARNLELGLDPDLVPVLGSISSFKASVLEKKTVQKNDEIVSGENK